MDIHKTGLLLLRAAIIFVILGGLCLIPSPQASKPNLWGYRSKCTFSPISTFILFLTAAVLFTARARIMNASGMKGTYVLFAVFSILFLTVIIFYSFKYVAAKKADLIKNNEPEGSTPVK